MCARGAGLLDQFVHSSADPLPQQWACAYIRSHLYGLLQSKFSCNCALKGESFYFFALAVLVGLIVGLDQRFL